MLKSKKRRLKYQDIIELNENFQKLKTPGGTTLACYLESKCFFCKKEVTLLYKSQSTIVTRLYLVPYNRFIWALGDVATAERYKDYSIVGYFGDIRKYLMHKECIDKFKIIPNNK